MPPSHAMTLLTETPKYVFIHHGATSPCSTQQECSTRVRSYQTFHMSAPPAGRGIIKTCFIFNFDNVYYILVVFSLTHKIKCIKYGVYLCMTYEFDRIVNYYLCQYMLCFLNYMHVYTDLWDSWSSTNRDLIFPVYECISHLVKRCLIHVHIIDLPL